MTAPHFERRAGGGRHGFADNVFGFEVGGQDLRGLSFHCCAILLWAVGIALAFIGFVGQPGHVAQQPAGGFQLGAHHGNPASNVRVIGQGLPVALGLALRHIVFDRTQGRKANAEIDGGIRNIETRLIGGQPFTDLRNGFAQNGLVRHEAVFENQIIATGRSHAERVPHPLEANAGRVGRQYRNEGRLWIGNLLRMGKETEIVGRFAHGAERFLARKPIAPGHPASPR